ncbi:hypothetical protein ACMD2_09041 [Ananas comosus]|uniref:Myb-like domain-containing protein n=1 Tax=Ananas comosus TaxID=4615 RepID=A0A199VK20_ANACO|nr:hypothetical protein ACMD2_09041 [Ananas comosus]
MSKKIAINGVANGVEPIGRRLRSRHTPLRRSPRLRSKNHGEVPMGNRPNSKKKPRGASSGETHLKSLPFSLEIEGKRPGSIKTVSCGRRRSLRLASTQSPLSDSEGMVGGRKTQVGSSSESRKSRSGVRSSASDDSGCRRRSLRSDSKSMSGANTSSRQCLPTVCGNASENRRKRLSSNLCHLKEKEEKLAPTHMVKCSRVQVNSTYKCCEGSQVIRRSTRLASRLAESEKKDANLASSGGTDCCMELRRSQRLGFGLPKRNSDCDVASGKRRVKGSTKVVSKVETNVDGLSSEQDGGKCGKEVKGSPLEITKKEVGETKSKKRARSVEAEPEVERSETEQCCGLEEWTEEQDTALQRAYLSAKPSPHFWKKVAKMKFMAGMESHRIVPRKSAEECFNRIHADLATPPPNQPRSRSIKIHNSPTENFNILDCNYPDLIESKVKRHRIKKQKTHLADQAQEADHFSVLETSPSPLQLDFPELKSPEISSTILRSSSSTHKKKTKSRFRPGQVDPSPECLRGSRTLRCTRSTSTNYIAVKQREGLMLRGNEAGVILKAARNALISEASNAIGQFKHMQANPTDDYAEFESGTDDDVDD